MLDLNKANDFDFDCFKGERGGSVGMKVLEILNKVNERIFDYFTDENIAKFICRSYST